MFRLDMFVWLEHQTISEALLAAFCNLGSTFGQSQTISGLEETANKKRYKIMIKNNFSKVGQWNLHLFFLVLPEEGLAMKSTFVFPGLSRSIYAQAVTNLVFHRRKGSDSGAETGEMFRVSPALGISIIHPWQPCSTFSIIHSFFFFFSRCDWWRLYCQDRWIDYHLSVHAQKSTDVMPFVDQIPCEDPKQRKWEACSPPRHFTLLQESCRIGPLALPCEKK